MESTLVDSLTHVLQLMLPGLWEWNNDLVKSVLNAGVASNILATPIKVQHQGRLVWLGTANGSFSSKTAYSLLCIATHPESTSVGLLGDFPRPVLKTPPDMAPKISLFIWRVLVGALPLKSKLLRRKIGDNNRCPLCEVEEETEQHLFDLCPVLPCSSSLGFIGGWLEYCPTC